MENIENIKNNLSNICYLYDLYRFKMEDFLTFEYIDDVEPEELKDTLNDYFIARSWDTPQFWTKFDEEGKITLTRSIEAFNKIEEISVDDEEKHVSFRFSFLSSVEEANKAMKMLEDGNIKKFKNIFPFFNERKLFDETQYIILIIQHLDNLLPLERDE